MQRSFAAVEAVRPPLGKAAQFRALLASPELEFLMEAHNGLSAKIVEETGFKGIWASGLSLSAAMGVRDRNEASWTQVLEVLEFMADATSIPILLDGDTGYGDFNNFRRLVRKLCQRGIAAVCIEDKVFPKTNSLLDAEQPLADIEEFCGKIKAGKDSQDDPDFAVIARVEALIAGRGLVEALKRAEAYRAAGADGILIHSKKSNADEILAFAKEWSNRAPLLIVPTTYYATPTDRFREAKVSIAIWANHNLRAAISAIRETSRRVFEEQSLAAVEGRVASVKDIFRLTEDGEVVDAERRYLRSGEPNPRALVLAATRGKALAALTEERPKCMLDIRGTPLLQRLVHSFNEAGIRNVSVVCGYKPEVVDLPNIEKIVNADYRESGEAASLACLAARLEGPTLIAYGDILFRNYILELLLQSAGDIVLAVDAQGPARRRTTPKSKADLVRCSQSHRPDLFLEDTPVQLVRMDPGLSAETADGEWIGLAKLTAAGTAEVKAEIEAMQADGSLDRSSLPDLFNRLVARGIKPSVLYVSGHWLDVNDAFDLAQARNTI